MERYKCHVRLIDLTRDNLYDMATVAIEEKTYYNFLIFLIDRKTKRDRVSQNLRIFLRVIFQFLEIFQGFCNTKIVILTFWS